MKNKKKKPGIPSGQKTVSADTSPSPAPAADNNQGLQLLSRYRGAVMGFAALWILAFHEWCALFTPGTTAADVEYFIKRIGFCGVDIFLFLSGIGLTYAIRKSSLPQFYYRRIKRIILPFLAMGILRCILEKWSAAQFWGNISGVNFYTKSMYSFLWFVPAIVTLYLVFPLFYKLFVKSGKPVLFLLLSLEIWLILSLAVRETMRGDLYGFTNRIPIFLIGICIGWMTQNRKVSFNLTTWVMLMITFILGLYLAYLTNYKGLYLLVPTSNCCMPNAMIAVSLPFLMAKVLDLISRYAAGRGLTKVLVFFGTFSLEFYCVQEWLSGKMIPVLKEKQMSALLINLIVLVSVTAVSFAAHYLFTVFWKLVDKAAEKVIPAKVHR